FFKALLFLSAGNVMHAMGNVIDMREFSGLRKVMPWTHWSFLCGGLALSGFPFLSGFWSKDEIFSLLVNATHHGEYRQLFQILFVIAFVTALLTAFYTFRAYFMTFWGPLKVPAEAFEHAGHGSHAEHHSHDAQHHGTSHAAAGAEPHVHEGSRAMT